MHFKSLSYHHLSEDGTALLKNWHFHNKQGSDSLTAQNLLVYAKKEELHEFIHAIAHVFSHRPLARMDKVLLTLSDNFGDHWQVDREKHQTLFQRNQKQFKNAELGRTFIQSALRGGDAELKEAWSEKIFVLYVDAAGQLGLREQGKKYSVTENVLQEFIKSNATEISKSIQDLFKDVSPEEIQKLSSASLSLDSLFHTNRELIKQHRNLLARGADYEGLLDSEALDEELRILTEMEALTKKLTEPSLQPRLLSEKIKKIQDRVETLEGPHHAVQIDLERIKPQEIFGCLARVEAFAKLVQANQHIRNLTLDRIKPITDSYLRTLGDLVAADSVMTKELQLCLNTLHQEMGKFEEQKKPSAATRAVRKFLQPTLGFEEQSSTIYLEKSRETVDTALQRLCEMHDRFKEIGSSFGKVYGDIQGGYESLAKSFGELKKQWALTAQENGLPEDIDLVDLINLLSHYLELNDLRGKLALNQRQLSEQKQNLHQLRDLIQRWNEISASQKDVNLTNASIIVSEAQAIIRTKDQKQKRKHLIESKKANLTAYASLKQMIYDQKAHVTHEWRTILKDCPSLSESSPDDSLWAQALPLLKQLNLWQGIKTDAGPTSANLADLLNGDINFVWVDPVVSQYRGAEALIQKLIDDLNHHFETVVFLSDQRPIYDLFVGSGLAFATPVSEKDTSQKVAIRPSVTPPSQPTSKTDDLLAIFQGKTR